jgi:site-specific DNA-methyltransferase (adenine-specific)
VKKFGFLKLLRVGVAMDIRLVNINDVKPYEKNPRKNDKAVDKVAASIKEFGFKQPLVVDKDGILIVGHTRLKAAQKLGIKEVPVIYAEDLTDEQVKAYRLADNKTGEFAEWDMDLLGGNYST